MSCVWSSRRPAVASVAADRAHGDNAALARDLDRATADPSFTGAVLTKPVLSFFAADATAYLATASGVARVTETATVMETVTETAGCSAAACARTLDLHEVSGSYPCVYDADAVGSLHRVSAFC